MKNLKLLVGIVGVGWGTLVVIGAGPIEAALAPSTADSVAGISPRASPLGLASASGLSGKTAAAGLPAAGKRQLAGVKYVRLNFRGVPLETVLDYFSRAAGLIIIMETGMAEPIEVWSPQLLNEVEAVNLLNAALSKKGYAALREGRTLTIVNRDEARKRNLPVQVGRDPQAVPKTGEMVTQIIPVRAVDAVQMIKDLQPLLPAYATLTANEEGNALVLTDTQSHIRRIMEIVQALDTALAANVTVRVWPLRYADAKELASVIKEMFPSLSSNGQGGSGSPGDYAPPMMFGGGPGGNAAGGAFDAGDGTTAPGGQNPTRRVIPGVIVVADDRMNALVVSAPSDIQMTIGKLVSQIDKNAEAITMLRVFPLRHADPVEMAEVLSNLFPSDSKADNPSTLQFGGGPFGPSLPSDESPAATSSRAKQKGGVLAVADQRTGSLIISAAKELMPHIEQVIAQLDASPAKKQKVFVYSLHNASAANVQQVLQDLFASQNAGTTGSSLQNNDPLVTRQNQASPSTAQSGSAFGNSNSRSSGGSSGSSLPKSP